MSEALLLEANLIKRFKPRFNVRLKDDKSYPYIKVTLGDDFPRVERTRKLPNDGSRYFGPYASASSVDEAMNLVRRLFPFRTCTIDIKDGRARAAAAVPPVPHQALPGPVHRGDLEGGLPPRHRPGGAVPRGQRGRARRGPPPRDGASPRSSSSTRRRRSSGTRSGRSSGRWRARRWPRSRGRSSTSSRSPARTTRRPSSCSSSATARCWAGTCSSSTRTRDVPDDEVLGSFLAAVLRPGDERPARGPRARARSPRPRTSRRSCAERRGSGVHLRTPQRGEKRELMELATRNAAGVAGARGRPLAGRRGPDARARSRSWPTPSGWPGRRCGSSATTSATSRARQSVGSMVVFEEGRPRTGEYRRFQIKTVQGAQRLREPPGGAAAPVPARQGGRGGHRGGAPLGDARPRDHRRRPGPGERRQGGARRARAARPAAGRPGQGARGAGPAGPAPSPCCCRSTSQALYLVQRLRDEAHRFAITYHRNLRAKRATRSAFDDLPGVGPKRRRELLKVFGSAKRVREAPVEQIAAVPGSAGRWRSGSRPTSRPERRHARPRLASSGCIGGSSRCLIPTSATPIRLRGRGAWTSERRRVAGSADRVRARAPGSTALEGAGCTAVVRARRHERARRP